MEADGFRRQDEPLITIGPINVIIVPRNRSGARTQHDLQTCAHSLTFEPHCAYRRQDRPGD
eukprot:4590025-Prymnesium_polylepis.1